MFMDCTSPLDPVPGGRRRPAQEGWCEVFILIHQPSLTGNERGGGEPGRGGAGRAGAAGRRRGAASGGRPAPGGGLPARPGAVAALLLPALAPVAALPNLDVVVLLLERRGEDVGAVVAADEVEVGNLRRAGGGLQAGQAGRADRAGREAGIAVGVVRRVDAQGLR